MHSRALEAPGAWPHHFPRMTAASPIPAPPLQGDTVRIAGDDQLYQVIGVDAPHGRCWLRAWPLGRHGSQVFEISLHQLAPKPHHRPGRPA